MYLDTGNESNTCYHKDNDSDEKGIQEDGHNCGMIVCQSCVKILHTKSATPLTPKEMTKQKLLYLRYRWVVFIGVLMEKLNSHKTMHPYGYDLMINDGTLLRKWKKAFSKDCRKTEESEKNNST